MKGSNCSRRNFLLSSCAITLGGASASAVNAQEGATKDVFAERGKFERLLIDYAHVNLGLAKPFSILHISDTHFSEAYPDERVAQTGKAAARTCEFGGRQIDAFESSLAWAKENVDYVLHTGDLMDFQSRANQDLVRKYLPTAPCFGSMGNHEFYSYLPEEVHTWQEPFKTRSWKLLADLYPYDARFNSQVVNGVNFVCIDDVFGTVQPDQMELFKTEVKKGLPIVLCMHVPFHDDETWLAAQTYWKNMGKKFRGTSFVQIEYDRKRQQEDVTTARFIDYLKGEKLLKAILAGHEHISTRSRFSPTAEQFVVGGNFFYHGRVVLFT